MNTPQTPVRRMTRMSARLGVALSVTMLGISTWGAITAGALPAGTAATTGMTATASGDSNAPFALSLTGPNNLCPGDTATNNYRWTTYMVPDAVDPAVLTYNSNGPIASAGATFAQPLFSGTGSPQVNKATGISDGLITPIPSFSFSVFEAVPGSVPTGNYKIGFACTLAGATERFWVTRISVVATQSAFTWTVLAPDTSGSTTTAATTTTSTTTTTTSTIPTTTTTRAGTTTTSVVTTTTMVGSTTTFVGTSTIVANVSGTQANSGQSSSSGSGTNSTLADTGSSTGPIVFWAIVLLVFGRLVILVSRPLRVRERDQR